MMRKVLFFSALTALIAGPTALWAEKAPPSAWGNVPLAFEANRGQSAPDVRFLVRGNGYGVFFTDDQTVIGFADGKKPVTMTLVNKNKRTPFDGLDPQPGDSHYFRGANGAQSVTAPRFARIRQNKVWSGIDVLYHISGRQFEYDFVLAPGARVSDIRLDFSGGTMSIASSGDLSLRVDGGEIRHERPFAYQEKNGARQPVEVRFEKLGKHRVGFAVGEYDHRLPLVIDPKLDYSTYLGGSNNATLGELGYGITVDALGHTYVTGVTAATDFPLAAPVQGSIAGGTDAFVVKISPDGTSLISSTYIGGSGNDEGHDIKVDQDGNIYITGFTTSANFPFRNGFQSLYGGGVRDAYLLKLNPDASQIMYSTFLGGNNDDRAYALAVSPAGDAYVAGSTQSANFPTLNASQPERTGGQNDAFVTRINPNGTLAYSTYLGGSGVDLAYDIALGPDGSAYVAGYTTSLNFPRVGLFTPFVGGPDDAFVVRLGPSSEILISLLLGGVGSDEAVGIALDQDANIYVTGYTASVNFPIWNALQPILGGAADIFVTKIHSDGSAIDFSTFWGSTEIEGGVGIAVDASGFVHVTGFTGSFAFPLINALQDRLNLGTPDLVRDAFLLKTNRDGSAVVYSTYLGGRSNDGALGLAVDAAGNAYVTGYTASSQLPVANALQPSLADTQDAFVLKFNAQDVVAAISTQVPALGLSRISLGGIQRSALFGYADVVIADGAPRPAGLEIIRVSQLGRTVSEVGLPLTPLIQHARLFVEALTGGLQESIAIVNPHAEDVTIDFYFTTTVLGSDGTDQSSRTVTESFTLPARMQLFTVLSSFPFNLTSGNQGTLTLDSSLPIAVTAVRAQVNSSSNLILTRVPIHSLEVAPDNRPAIVDHFVEGGGWHTQVVLINPTDADVLGAFQFFGPGNAAATTPLQMEMSHATGTSFPYRIPAGSVMRVSTQGSAEEFTTGFIKVVPDSGHVTPLAFAIVEHVDDTAATFEAQKPGDRFRVYAESTPAGGTDLPRRFALGMTNSSDTPVTVLLEMTNNDGTPAGVSAQVTMPAGTQISRFLDEIPGLESAPATFRGVVKVTVLTGTGVTVTGVQAMGNEDGVFLMTTTGPIREDASQSTATVFPYIPTGAQYTTSLILFGTANGAGTSGEVRTFDSTGTPMFLVLQ